MTTQTMDIMERAEMLPIDLKLELVDRLLESISPSQKELDELWGCVSEPGAIATGFFEKG